MNTFNKYNTKNTEYNMDFDSTKKSTILLSDYINTSNVNDFKSINLKSNNTKPHNSSSFYYKRFYNKKSQSHYKPYNRKLSFTKNSKLDNIPFLDLNSTNLPDMTVNDYNSPSSSVLSDAMTSTPIPSPNINNSNTNDNSIYVVNNIIKDISFVLNEKSPYDVNDYINEKRIVVNDVTNSFRKSFT